MSNLHKIFSVVFFLLLALPTAPGHAANNDSHVGSPMAAVRDGEALPVVHGEKQRTRLLRGARQLESRQHYLKYCGACHGERGSGGKGASDFTSPEAVARLTRNDMVAQTQSGHDNAVSTVWGEALDANQLGAVVDFIRESLMLPAPVADASAGRSIYARTCSVCHGERGNAASWARDSLNPSPADFTAGPARKMSRESMIDAVTFGVTRSAMMPFTTQLSRVEIAAVVDYIRANFIGPSTAKRGHSRPIAGTPHRPSIAHGNDRHRKISTERDKPFLAGLIGDRSAGHALYEINCADCHGGNGNGHGRRAYFMRKKPADFTSAHVRAAFNRPHLHTAISKGVNKTQMPAWSKVLTPQQIADVAEYVFQAFIHPPQTRSRKTPARKPTWTRPNAADGKKKH